MQKTINKTATITRSEMEKLVRAHYKLEDDFKIVVTGLTYENELDMYNKFPLGKKKTAPALPDTVWCDDNTYKKTTPFTFTMSNGNRAVSGNVMESDLEFLKLLGIELDAE